MAIKREQLPIMAVVPLIEKQEIIVANLVKKFVIQNVVQAVKIVAQIHAAVPRVMRRARHVVRHGVLVARVHISLGRTNAIIGQKTQIISLILNRI